MSRFKGTRRLRGSVVLGLASLALAAAPGAFGTPKPKPPPKPPGASVQPNSSAADQYAPPRAAIATTARARRVGLCKRAVVKRFTATRAKCKNAKCRAKAQHDQAVAMRRCNTLIRV